MDFIVYWWMQARGADLLLRAGSRMSRAGRERPFCLDQANKSYAAGMTSTCSCGLDRTYEGRRCQRPWHHRPSRASLAVVRVCRDAAFSSAEVAKVHAFGAACHEVHRRGQACGLLPHPPPWPSLLLRIQMFLARHLQSSFNTQC